MKIAAGFIILITSAFLIFSCGEDKEEAQLVTSEYRDIATSPELDLNTQKQNLEIRKDLEPDDSPCSPLSVMEYVIGNYPSGAYLLSNDEQAAYSVPEPAVLNYEGGYIFAVIAVSREGERLIEPENIIGYDQSFIDYDSTDLGTAFFYLVLFECRNETLSHVWQSPVYTHGGLKKISAERWTGIPYIKVEFYNALDRGSVSFNYFLINGIRELPHLLMTYNTIHSRRTMEDLNKDNYPDYYEYIFYESEYRIVQRGRVGFIWNPEKKMYISTGNRKQSRPY